MSMTTLEKVLADALAKVTQVDIPAIIAAAQACCVGGCETEVVVDLGTLGEPERAQPKPEKAPRTKKEVETVKPVETPVVLETKTEPAALKPPTFIKHTTVVIQDGINLTGLFTGTGADKKVVKAVFLNAVEQSKTLSALVALNATCDCGFATGDYTEETAPVLKRKLARWGAAQE
jgi:hypothetical protein